ncbi:MAG: OmpA family protein [Bacteroidetes bacterium]|nr:OmpA family protein [Bacteroidota bacterium]
MRIIRLTIILITISAFLSACVTKKKYSELDQTLKMSQNSTTDCETKQAKSAVAIKKLNEQIKELQGALDSTVKQVIDAQSATKNNDNNQLINVLKDMSVLTPSQAEGVTQSLQAISTSGQTPDALKANLISNLKSSIGGDNDTDISIQNDKGSLYIDLTDHMFFNSGSSDLTDRAKMIIGKVAKILNAYPDMHFMIEGHTDNKPIHTATVADNWDLSIRRATTVVRVLQKQYGIKPERMAAAGRGEYMPVAANDTPVHRAENRRVSIVITPGLDEYMKLLIKK